MVFMRPFRISLCTFITIEMPNTGSCRADDCRADERSDISQGPV